MVHYRMSSVLLHMYMDVYIDRGWCRHPYSAILPCRASQSSTSILCFFYSNASPATELFLTQRGSFFF